MSLSVNAAVPVPARPGVPPLEVPPLPPFAVSERLIAPPGAEAVSALFRLLAAPFPPLAPSDPVPPLPPVCVTEALADDTPVADAVTLAAPPLPPSKPVPTASPPDPPFPVLVAVAV